MQELQQQSYKERVTKEREKSIEDARKAREIYEVEMQMEEEKRRLLEDKDKRKREAVERANCAMQELKERKKDIDGMFMEKQRQVKNKVNQKDQLIQEKNLTIEEERALRAAELRQLNEVKIK